MTGKTDSRNRVSGEARVRMLELYASDMPTRDIAERFRVDELYVRKVASRSRVRKGQPIPAAPEPPSPPPKPRGHHLAAHHRARRGFYVPPALEPAYTRLLIAGMSRQDAAERLGLKGGTP